MKHDQSIEGTPPKQVYATKRSWFRRYLLDVGRGAKFAHVFQKNPELFRKDDQMWRLPRTLALTAAPGSAH
jgi:hypothetical protein